MKNKILSILLAVTMVVALFVPMVAVSAETATPGHIAISFGTLTIDDYDGALIVPIEIAENTGDIFAAKIYIESLDENLEAGYWENGDITDTDEGGRRPVEFGLECMFNDAEASITCDRTKTDANSSTGLTTTGTIGYMYFYTKDGSDIDPANLDAYKFNVGKSSKVVSIHNDANGQPIIHTIAHYHTPFVATETVPAECGKEGSVTKSCTYCGEVFEQEKIEALEHKFENYVPKDAAECGKNATEEATCENEGCNEKDVRDVAGSALEHKYTNYVYQEDAKCGVNGTEKAECDNGCGTVDVRSKDGTALEHKYTNYVYQNDAKCEIDGTEKAECDNGCGNVDVKTKAGTALAHQFTNYVYNEDAVCGVDGTKTAKCDHNCGEEDTIKADGTALTHKYTNYVSNEDAECGVNGTETAHCDHGCGTEDTRVDEDSALEHSYTNYVYNNDAKCGVDGTETAECDHGCGNKATRAKAGTALTHKMVKDEENYKDAKCGVEGADAKVCEYGCGHKESTPIPALEHEFTEYVCDNNATTTANCTETAECDNGCGEKDVKEILGTMLVPEVDMGGLKVEAEEGKVIPGDTFITESDAAVNKDTVKGYDVVLKFTFYSLTSENGLDGINGTLTFDMSDLPYDEYDSFVFGVIGADGKVTIIEDAVTEGNKVTFNGALTADYVFLGVPKKDVSNTSDNFNMVVYVALALASVIGLAVVGKKRFAL